MNYLKTDNHFYHFAWQCSRHLLSLFYRVEFHGTQYIPEEGGFILAGNHASMIDPPAFGCGVPKEIAYFARKSLFKPGIRLWILNGVNSIPVERGGDSDIGAFRRIFTMLKNGGSIVLFPEGTRTPDGHLHEAQRGIGMIACRMNMTVLPARIFGSYEAFGRQHWFPALGPVVNIIYGKPLSPEDYDPGKSDPDRYQNAANTIMDAISALEVPTEIGAT